MPDVFLTRRQLCLLAVEATYGVDAAPEESNSFQAIRLVDPFTLDLGQEWVEVEGGQLTRGRSRPIATVRPAGITFRTYIHGIDVSTYTANVKPPLADAIRACGRQETFEDAGNGVYRYDDVADVSSDVSVTIVANQDGFDHRLIGCRGNMNLIYTAHGPVVAEFTFRGILSTEASTARGAPTLPTVTPPLWVGSGTMYVESVMANVENINFNTNNTIFEERSSTANSGSGIIKALITNRAPGGSFDPEATDPSTMDFFSQWRAASGSILRLQVGVSAGNRFTLVASQAIFKNVGWGDKEGMSIFSTDFEAYERSTDDSWRLTFD